ncbi:MAG: AraC family transcriptional regulator [Pseudomonadota bacterium]
MKRALDGSSMSFDPNEVTKCPLVQFAWDELRREGRTTLGDLSDRVGLSLRRLEQVFRNTFDLSPKQVQSLFRYERATAFLRDGNTNLVETALLAGYSDQSHMTREFRRFAAVTPATMRAALRIAE